MVNFDTKMFPTWCPGCLLPSVPVHTKDGLKDINQVKIGDLVLTHEGIFNKVSKVFKHKHNGNVYEITTKCFGSLTLTPEHPVLSVERLNKKKNNSNFPSNWTRADRLKKGDYLVFPIPKDSHDLKTIRLNRIKSSKDTKSRVLPTHISLGEEVLFIFGLYLAEGWVHSRATNFAFHLREKILHTAIIKTFKKVFGLNATVKQFPNKSLVEIYVNHSVLARQFSNWFGNGAVNKRIPGFLLSLPPIKQTNIIRGLWAGDGYIYKNKAKASYKTVSPTLAHQLKLLLLRQGIVPTISVNKAYKNHNTSYSVQITSYDDFKKLCQILKEGTKLLGKLGGKPPVIRNGSYVYLPIRKIQSREYSGYVHNLEVDEQNSFVSINSSLHNCGDFGIWAALKGAIRQLNLQTQEFVMVYDIGCSGNMASHIKAYGFHGLHGRAIPAATGIKLANHHQKVVVIGGDGGLLGEGMAHFISACRANMDITVILHNNQIYGLTTGQSSPTSMKGTKGKATPLGVVETPVEPCAFALLSGASFVARSFAGTIPESTKIIAQAISHKGFSLVEMLQPCVTFNKLNTYDWFRQRVKPLTQTPTDAYEAMNKARWTDQEIYLGVFRNDETATAYHETFAILKDKTLIQYHERRDLAKYISTPHK